MTKPINWTKKADEITASFMLASEGSASGAAASIREHTGLPVTSEDVTTRWSKIKHLFQKQFPWSETEKEILLAVVNKEASKSTARSQVGKAIASEILDATGLFRSHKACTNKAMRVVPDLMPAPAIPDIASYRQRRQMSARPPVKKQPFVQTILRICAENASEPSARVLVETLVEQKQATVQDLLEVLWPNA